MPGHPQHCPLRQRDPNRGRHGSLGEAEGAEAGRSLEARAGELS